MNLCILSGKVVNDIGLKFIYNENEKKLSKKHVSIVELKIKIEKEQKVKLYAYDDIADYIYINIQKDDSILVEGILRNNYVEISKIYLCLKFSYK